jgi:regulator of sigma E protease
VRASGGRTLDAVFAGDDGKRITVPIEPQAEMQVGSVAIGEKTYAIVQHLLGLTPVMKVAPPSDASLRKRQGLEDDDIFARLGAAEFPGPAQGIAEIRSHKGRQIPVSVLRRTADGGRTLVRLDPPPTVSRQGLIGFERSDTASESTMLSLPPARIVDAKHTGQGAVPSAAAIIKQPGMAIVAIGNRELRNFSDIRAAILEATRDADSRGATVQVTLAFPSLPGAAEEHRETVMWSLSAEDLAAIRALSWTSKLDSGFFKPEEFVLKAAGPLDALRMGLAETKRVMMSTYITFARLFQGTVKVEHLKGPVGIAHLGTRIAERGTIWLLFFMALISVNLAVINFLPLPVVDGGQFLFLLIEQVRGKPVPLAIQNVATLAGLLLIGTVFIIVTFHDIANLFG